MARARSKAYARQWPDGSRYVVVELASGFTDFPIQYSDGRIAYDFPERIPPSVKRQVEDLFKYGRIRRAKYYVGVYMLGASQLVALKNPRVVFKSFDPPTCQNRPDFGYTVGPFRTMRGANYMAKYGNINNPHCQTVAQAERLAKEDQHNGLQ